MTTINEIFKIFHHEYIEKFGDSMPANHLKAIRAIVNCRTQKYGITFYECNKCGETHRFFKSCGNRHCPVCQNHKTRKWLEKQLEKQLPGHHFMVTFTVPKQIRMFIRSNQRLAYSALFRASSAAMKVLAADKKHIGGDLPGFFGVLHTWGRTLQYHPHIHYVVAGGAWSKQERIWHPSRMDFYVPIKALSKIFKAKFIDEMKKAGLFEDIPSEAWRLDWNVNIQAVGSSEKSVKYLAPYVFKVAISNSRIARVEGRKVTFLYKKGKSSRMRSITLDAMEFIRRFLQHVLPKGFMKIRYYGFMHPCSSMELENIRALIELSYGFDIEPPESTMEPIVPLSCPKCGGELKYLYSVLPHQMSLEFNSS